MRSKDFPDAGRDLIILDFSTSYVGIEVFGIDTFSITFQKGSTSAGQLECCKAEMKFCASVFLSSKPGSSQRYPTFVVLMLSAMELLSPPYRIIVTLLSRLPRRRSISKPAFNSTL